MSEKRLRISIVCLLTAVAIASFGCGGGSGAGPAPGGGSITAVIPGGSASYSESENAVVEDTPSKEGGENEHDSSLESTPGSGGAPPPGSTRNAQISRQFDYSSVPEGHIALPPGHGLEPAQISVPHGFSELRGDIIISCPSQGFFTWCHINIEENGLATYDGNDIIPNFRHEKIPLPRKEDTAQAPVLDFVTSLHVGSKVAPQVDELTQGAARSGVRFSHGEVQDGIDADRLLEFMGQHVRSEDKFAYSNITRPPGLETYPESPTIRLAEGTSDLYARYAAHAVQLINSALPYEKRITLSTETLPEDTTLNDVPEGEIFLNFASTSNSFQLGGALIASRYVNNPVTNQQEVGNAIKASAAINEEIMRLAYVHRPTEEDPYHWQTEHLNARIENSDKSIKLFNDDIFLSVVVHELMHTLGFYHIDESKFSDSIMHSKANDDRGQVDVFSPYLPESTAIILIAASATGGDVEETIDESSINTPENEEEDEITVQPVPRESQGHLITAKARTVPGHILFPLDRAALLAAYGRFAPGAQPEELTAENLGSWTDKSFHLRGSMDLPRGEASFGVASANGLAQPWATGPTPWTDLADNEFLSGSATWSGALLGVGSSAETVAGDAALSVNLSSLTGRIDFTNMEKWGAGAAPGAADSGEAWGDGDLGYTISVRGNTFYQTGGDGDDDGHVTGAFFGASHEAMGGVLERADLSAAFGGKR